MTVSEIMAELEAHGSESIKKILVKHGVKEPFFGTKIEFMKPIQKKIKKDYRLAKDLFATGNSDAMDLAGLIADDKRMTTDDLQSWAENALSNNINEYTVPWVAAESDHGMEVALKWIDDPREHVQSAGWATLGNIVALTPDDKLDISLFKKLIERVVKTIHEADNRVRYRMNSFVISVGGYVPELTTMAEEAAGKIGNVQVEMFGTACRVPNIVEYIDKMRTRGTLGKKKKTVKC
jgi:3-methyladenine DNA glycosylase AlkD